MIPFLKYKEGATPGKKSVKRTSLTEEEKVGAKKRYEEKRQRKFQRGWQEDRPWLDFVDGLMYCSWCKNENVANCKFVTGTDHFRIDSVREHENSKWHKHFTPKYKPKATADTHSTPLSEAAKCLKQLHKADYERLVIKFRNAHAIAKHHRSFRDYKFLCMLDKVKGLDVGSNYLNDKSAAMFVHSIASVTRTQVCEKLRKANFFSLTCDGATDFTGEELENVYVRICNNGKVEDFFLCIGSPSSTSAKDIHSHIGEMFENFDLSQVFQEKLIGFCSDGASNMQGCKSGLAALLKQTRPYMVATHCLAHRLELAFKDAIKAASPKLYEKTMTLLIGLYYLYRRSPTQKKALKISFQSLQQTIILPTRVGGTRWLPHSQRAINAFVKGYCAIRQQLENSSHKNAKTEGLAKLMRDGQVIAFILTLKELIGHLMKLSLYLQKSEISLADAFTRVAATKTLLTNMATRDVQSVNDIVTLGTYQGRKLNFLGQKPNPRPQNLLDNVISALNSRFPQTPVVQATALAAFNNWPNKGEDSIAEFGVKEMEFLATHFKHFLSVESGDILNEWELLKVLIYERFGDALETQTWKSIQQKLSGDGLENVFLLIDMIRTLPPTSVKNETTFSAMKLTKGKRRGRMKNSTLNDLLTVQIQSSNVENFDPDESIQCWMKTPSGRKRRIVPKIKNPAEQRNQRHILQPVEHSVDPLAFKVVADVVPNEVHVDEVLADHSDEVHIEEAAAFAEQHGLIPDHGDAGVVTPSVNSGEEDESDDEELEEEYDFEDSEESDNEMTELEVERELELL